MDHYITLKKFNEFVSKIILVGVLGKSCNHLKSVIFIVLSHPTNCPRHIINATLNIKPFITIKLKSFFEGFTGNKTLLLLYIFL